MNQIEIPKVAFARFTNKKDINLLFGQGFYQRMSFKITSGSIVYYGDF